MVMDESNRTGETREGGTQPQATGPATATFPLTKGDRSGEKYAGSLRSSGSLSTGSQQQPEATSNGTKAVLAEKVISARYIFGTCEEAISSALENDDDIVAKSNALDDLRGALSRLWDMRNSREEAFGDLIAHLQALFLDIEPEELPSGQIEAIGRVVRQAAIRPRLTDADLRDFEGVLIKAGCDVFRELE